MRVYFFGTRPRPYFAMSDHQGPTSAYPNGSGTQCCKPGHRTPRAAAYCYAAKAAAEWDGEDK